MNWAEPDSTGLNRTELNGTELNRTELNWTGLDWTRLDSGKGKGQWARGKAQGAGKHEPTTNTLKYWFLHGRSGHRCNVPGVFTGVFATKNYAVCASC